MSILISKTLEQRILLGMIKRDIMITDQFIIRTTIPNVYAPNNRISKEMLRKLIALKGEMDKSASTVGYFNTLKK